MIKRTCFIIFSLLFAYVIRAQNYITEDITYIYGEPLKQYAVVVETIEFGSNAGDQNKYRKVVDRSAYMLSKKYKQPSTVVKSNEKNLYRILLATSDDLRQVIAVQSKVSERIGHTYILKITNDNQNTSNEIVANQTTTQTKDTGKSNELVKTETSDVDIDIPITKIANIKTFAVIIANEDYQEEDKVMYAVNDGEVFKDYCNKVLGIPEENIHIRKNATLNNIKAELYWMQQVADAYKGQARFIVFYAGHGVPDEKSANAYLLPVDGSSSVLESGYRLADFYKTLGNLSAELVTVFMDACFCGAKRGEGNLSAARGVAIKVKPEVPQGKMIVFSAAQGDETAWPLMGKQHGLFTYYLLKKLKNTRGNTTYGELGTYIQDEVARKGIVVNGKGQHPTVTVSQAVVEEWRSIKLK